MSFLTWSRHRKRVIICRILACTLTATLLCFVFFPFSVTAASIIPRDAKHGDLHDWTEHAAHEKEHRPSEESLPPVEEYPSPAQLKQAQAQVQVQEPLREEPAKIKIEEQYPSVTQLKEQPASSTDHANHDIAKAMRHISTLFPDELQMKGLLAPFAETGEAHVRDLGLRVRVFKKAFEAWEALHLVHFEGSMHQQDVIQKLRKLNLPSVDLRKTIQTYDRFRSYVNKLADHLFPWTGAYFPDHMSLHAALYSGGRGIVITAGNDQAKFLLTSIPSFRQLGCQLPIEVLYLGDSDLDEEWRDKLEALPGVITRDLSQMINDVGWTLKGWAAKPFAMLMSSFREVLFIDADALFFVDPEILFEDEAYIETGALFFADRNLSPQNDKRAWLRQVLPKPISEQVQRENRLWTGESVHMQDSGVVLVDKWRHFVAMLLTTRLNGPDRDGNVDQGKRGVYDMVYGDKETFWLSWELAEDDGYSFHSSVAGNMGVLEEEPDVDLATSLTALNYELYKEKALRKLRTPDSDSTDSDLSELDPSDTYINYNALPTPDIDIPAKPKIPTLCSPQLLHFDRDGKPLWWNGWIATSKFKEDHGKMQTFEVYVKEPRNVLKPEFKDRWDIRGSNVVCLRSDDVTPFTEKEHEVLSMIMDIARENTPE